MEQQDSFVMVKPNVNRLISLIEESLPSYNKLDQLKFTAWRTSNADAFKKVVLQDWGTFHDLLEIGDYCNSSESAWTPREFKNVARWIMYGPYKTRDKTRLIEPAIIHNGLNDIGSISDLKVIDAYIEDHRLSVDFPQIELDGKVTSFHLELDYDSVEQEDGGYDTEGYSISCSRKLSVGRERK